MVPIANDVHGVVHVDDGLDVESVKMVMVADDGCVEWLDEIRMSVHRPLLHLVHMHQKPDLEFVNGFDVNHLLTMPNVILAFVGLAHVERLKKK